MCSGYEISVEELVRERGEVRTSSDFREPRQDEQAEPIFFEVGVILRMFVMRIAVAT